MLSIFDFARTMELSAVCTRLVAAIVCGGLIGMERELKRRHLGFRTHILICLGAALTILAGEYLYVVLHYNTEVSRIGSSVVAGISFLGAGSIVVSKQKTVKGLTTAAGLWVTAIIGLMCGSGYIEGGLLATLAVLFIENVLSHFEHRSFSRISRELRVEYTDAAVIEAIISEIRSCRLAITGLSIEKVPGEEGEKANCCAVITVKGAGDNTAAGLKERLGGLSGIVSVS